MLFLLFTQFDVDSVFSLCVDASPNVFTPFCFLLFVPTANSYVTFITSTRKQLVNENMLQITVYVRQEAAHCDSIHITLTTIAS